MSTITASSITSIDLTRVPQIRIPIETQVYWNQHPIPVGKCIADLHYLGRLAECTHAKPRKGVYGGGTTIDMACRPLFTEDIVLQSPYGPRIIDEPGEVPWNDGVRLLHSDIMTVLQHPTANTYIFFTVSDYQYDNMIMAVVCSIVMERPDPTGKVIIVRSNLDEQYDVTICYGYHQEPLTVTVKPTILPGYLAALTNGASIVACVHEDPEGLYMEVINHLPKCTWSYPSTDAQYVITPRQSGKSKYGHMCQIHGHSRSHQTRAIGTGPLRTTETRPLDHVSKLNYYNNSIRSVTFTTGKCYDCQVLSNVYHKLANGDRGAPDPSTVYNISIRVPSPVT